MKRFLFLGLLACSMLVIGCASMNKKFVNKNVPIQEHAVFYIGDYSFVSGVGLSINTPYKSRSALGDVHQNTKSQTILLPPGEHTIYFNGFREFERSQPGALADIHLPNEEFIMLKIPVTWERHDGLGGNYGWKDSSLVGRFGLGSSSSSLSFTFNFEAGRHYQLYAPAKSNNRGTLDPDNIFVLVDETNPQDTWSNTENRGGPTNLRRIENRVSKTKSKLSK